MPIKALPSLNQLRTSQPITRDSQTIGGAAARRPITTIPDPTDFINNAGPGVNPESVFELNDLTQQNIQAALESLRIRSQLGIAGVDLNRQQLQNQFDIALAQLQRGREQSVEAIENNALQRGIFRSGILQENIEESEQQFAEAEAGLRSTFTLDQEQLALQIEQILADLSFDSANAVTELSLGDLSLIESLLAESGLQIGDLDINNAIGITGGGGQAPDNILNRNHPVYRARANFVQSVIPDIEAMFGVTSWGQWRDPADAHGAGRSPNSDHLSGGAADFHGSPAQMAALAQWAKTQPFVSFVRYGDRHHKDHVHISFNLGVGGNTDIGSQDISGGGGGTGGSGGGNVTVQ